MPRRLLAAALAAGALLALPAAAPAASTTIVISELRTHGPAGGNDEFVELRNISSSSQAIGGWRLQGCAGGSGNPSTRTTVPAGTSIPAGGAYLFANSAGTLASQADATYGTGISDDGGVRIADAGGAAVDGVANQDASADQCREGTGLTFPGADADNGFERIGGTQDTDDNAADFTGPKASSPQNSGGDVEPPEPEITPIHDIQGAGSSSPMSGRTVTIEGVVTGVDDEIGASFTRVFPADAGLFVQEEPGDADADPSTSEGIFVGFVRDRAAYPPGTVVRINGRVRENFGETRIEEAFGEEPEALGTAAVPPAVLIDPAAAAAQAAGSRPYYETLEGMNVLLAEGTANSGGRNKFGETFLTPGPERDRVLRTEAAQPDLLAADSDAGAGDPSNPLVDTDSTTELPVDLFDAVRNLEGPLGFSFSHFKIINQEAPRPQPLVVQGPTEYPWNGLDPRRDNQIRVASFNVENFFPVGGDLDMRIVSEEEYAEKRDRIVDAIGRLLERPDVVAVQEVFDKAILEDVAAQLGGYSAYLEEGNDSRGIDVGFLVRDTLKASDVRQLGKDAAGPEGFDCSDVDGGLFDRPPLAIDLQRRSVRFTLFSNHFSSKSAPDECRAAQAAFVRDRVAELEADGREAIVAGDLNAFEDESALTTLQDGTTSLVNLWSRAPAEERYSFHFDGRLQTLDHILVTDGLEPRVDDFLYAHFDNDYYDRRDPTDGHRVSDHDPPVVTLAVPGAPRVLP